MSELQSIGLRRYWKNKSKKEKVARATHSAKARMKKLTPKQKRAIAMKMVKARLAKSNAH
jgi:hypothetical protein